MSSPPDRPLVSCIVTTFNYAHFVTQAIDSALAQTYGEQALEVIVVDGASTDDTPAAMEPYLPRITYIRESSNEGVVSSANRGLQTARGDLIAFLNADDVWYPTTVERLANHLAARPDSGLAYGDMEMIDAESRSIHPSYHEQFGVRPESGWVLGRLLRGNFIASGCFMFRAELLPACHPIPDWAAWEDWYITLRLAKVAQFGYLPEPVLRYRFHGANQVLMAEGERLVATWHKEVSFRRRLLIEIAPRTVSPEDLVGAVAAFDTLGRRLGEAAPHRLADAVLVDDAERAEASAAAAVASRSEQEQDDESALAYLTRALAHDPADRDIRRRFSRVAARLLNDVARTADERRAALEQLSHPAPTRSVRDGHEEPVDEALRSLRELIPRISATAPEPVPEQGTARHEALLAELPDDLAGRRVLDVPGTAPDMVLALGLRGAKESMALAWEELDPSELGRFDLIHADGVLDGAFRPLAALEQIRELLADGGRLYLGFTRAAGTERSELVHLLDDGNGDGGALPGRTALSWMVEAAGLSTLREIGVAPSERGGLPVECGYLELTA